ncbi:MAG: pyridoxamine 5'-phosphate oxidase, partial [Actinobacteria bacterium]
MLPTFPESLSTRRFEYETAGLERADLAADPITQFIRWFDDASNAGLEEPHAMTLATTTPDRRPDARMVLLRGVDERGFVWFTNRNSRKGRELEVTPFATLVFAWIPLHRQIRVDGEVTVIDDAESDAYFASRPRAAQIGAWASQQSEVLDERATLDAAVREIEERFGEDPISRPPHWGGYRLAHDTLEVWQGRANRLHDR